MEVQVGNLGNILTDLSKVKFHQYCQLKDAYRAAVRNNHKEVEWLGNVYAVQYANYLIEYLEPRFKGII